LREVSLPVLSFGIDHPCDVTARDVVLSLSGIRARVETAQSDFAILSPLVGRFNLYNILAAVAAAMALRIPVEAVQKGIAELKEVPGRLEKISRPGEPEVFVDYAHTDDALRRVLQNLSGFKQGRLLTLFGCGGDRDRGKRPLMGRAAAELSDLVILTSDNPRTEEPLEIIRQIESGIPAQTMKKVPPETFAGMQRGKHYSVIPDRAAAIEKIIDSAGPSDMVLIAGKGHEDYQILGNKRVSFDDRVFARSALERRSQGKSH
jgi:UDP-N-acetylmuramoyl-L-alanyl-D-glutamate--2,6-diaminopimelate ligase